jgi:hypothetical protein
MNKTFCTESRAAYNLPMLNQVCQTVKLYEQKVDFLFWLSDEQGLYEELMNK